MAAAGSYSAGVLVKECTGLVRALPGRRPSWDLRS